VSKAFGIGRRIFVRQRWIHHHPISEILDDHHEEIDLTSESPALHPATTPPNPTRPVNPRSMIRLGDQSVLQAREVIAVDKWPAVA